ncbi:MAG: TatD family hydrolase [Anaerolineae bacterium]
MQFCDSHCHLESARYDADRAAVVARAQQSAVTMMISCGSDIASSEREVELTAEYSGVYAAVGIHGHQATTALRDKSNPVGAPVLDDPVFQRIAQLATARYVVALGELGLDYHYDFSPRPLQQAVLARQLALAKELNLPVILHNRDADDDTRRIVDEAVTVHGVLHCFLGSSDLADWAVNRGLYLGVAGPITYPKMEQLASVLSKVPRDRLLIETDSPYLAPQAHRGQRNEPGRVIDVAVKLGQVLGMTLEQVAELTLANTRACFGI